jgi:hypothetical protein
MNAKQNIAKEIKRGSWHQVGACNLRNACNHHQDSNPRLLKVIKSHVKHLYLPIHMVQKICDMRYAKWNDYYSCIFGVTVHGKVVTFSFVSI